MMMRLLLVAASAVMGMVGGYLARGCFGSGQPCVPEVWPALRRLNQRRKPLPSLPAAEGNLANK